MSSFLGIDSDDRYHLSLQEFHKCKHVVMVTFLSRGLQSNNVH
jgi:hypothetical protein